MLTTISGIPTHILVIHAVVVGIPLAAIVSSLIAFRKDWRQRYRWAVLGIDVLVLGSTWLAKESGEHLFNKLASVVQQQAAHHRSLGETLVWFVLALLVAVVALIAADRVDNKILTSGLGVIVLATAVLAVVRVVQTGDAGAHAVWNGVIH